MLNKKTIRKIFGISVLLLFLLSGACSTGKPPVAKVAAVETAIIQARENIAATYAPLELKLAIDKLSQAKALMKQKDYLPAGRLLDEALVDAQLAEAKSRSQLKKIRAAELQDSIDALHKEIEFKSRVQ
ncbi:MAG: DUF4398 domain-containing protein [Desulfobacteraceae bacterium]|nr:MAG: DUF4398 domain-containing protein [Desulfobacteraceae bacterium]